MIPAEIKFDANATPPQWTDDGEQVIEKGTNIRIKIKGLRSEVDKMYAVGTMKEVRRITSVPLDHRLITALRITLARCRHRKHKCKRKKKPAGKSAAPAEQSSDAVDDTATTTSPRDDPSDRLSKPEESNLESLA